MIGKLRKLEKEQIKIIQKVLLWLQVRKLRKCGQKDEAALAAKKTTLLIFTSVLIGLLLLGLAIFAVVYFTPVAELLIGRSVIGYDMGDNYVAETGNVKIGEIEIIQ